MKTLLLVFAHPDDESFITGGTIATYADLGWNIELLCATRGDAGQSALHDSISRRDLGDIRDAELAEAAKILGIANVMQMSYKDGALKNIPPGEIEEKIYKHMRYVTPDVVVTFDSTGISNHPDHIRIGRSTTYAFQKYAKDIEHTLTDADAYYPKLYYTVLPRTVVRFLQDKKILTETSFGKPWVGTEDKFISTVIDIAPFADVKTQAARAHKTQRHDWEKHLAVPNNPILTHEHYVLRMHGTREVFMGKNDTVSSEL